MILNLPHFRSLVLALVTTLPVAAQSISVYENSSTDGSRLYATGVLQYNPGSNCGMCSSAYHTYLQAVQITTPSGRTMYCNNNSGSSAAYAQNFQCEADISIEEDYGDYVRSGSGLYRVGEFLQN